jgi:hypothetical protein
MGKVAISDLSVTLRGHTFTGTEFEPGVAAAFLGGVFIGIDFDVSSVPTGYLYTDVASVNNLVLTTAAGQTVQGAAAFFAVPTGVVADEEVDSAMRGFVAAGGTSELLYQTAAAWSTTGTGTAVVLEGATIEVSPVLLRYANANPSPDPADDKDKPLGAFQLRVLTRHLEQLAEGKKPLSTQQEAEMKRFIERLEKNGIEDSTESALKDLNKILGALGTITSRAAPPVGLVLDLYNKLVDGVIKTVNQGITESAYATFKQQMDGRGGLSVKKQFEILEPSLRPEFAQKFYLRYQAELLKEKLKPSDKK